MATEAEGQDEVWKAGVWDIGADAEREVGVSVIWKDHKNYLWGVDKWCIDVTGESYISYSHLLLHCLDRKISL